MDEAFVFYFVCWIISVAVCGGIGYGIGKGKGLETEGAFLGALLGVLGVAIVAGMKAKEKPVKWKPGQYAAKADPFEEFELRQKSATILAPPPHLKNNPPPPETGEGE